MCLVIWTLDVSVFLFKKGTLLFSNAKVLMLAFCVTSYSTAEKPGTQKRSVTVQYTLQDQRLPASVAVHGIPYLVFIEACKLLLSDIFIKSHVATPWLHNKINVYTWQWKSPTLAAESKHHLAWQQSSTPVAAEAMSCKNWATPMKGTIWLINSLLPPSVWRILMK